MTTPGGSAPDGAWVVGGRYGSDITKDSAKAIISGGMLAPYKGAQRELKAVDNAFKDDLKNFEDSQLALKDRLDLLESVNGYCSLFLSKNWNLRGNGEWRLLPFDTQLGPRKGTSLEASGIKLAGKGLWRCDAHITWYPAPSGWGQSNTAAAARVVVVYADTLTIYTERRFDMVITPYGSETASFSHTFVIPDDDKFIVRLEAGHSRDWHMLYGGTVRSALSVNKWDTGTNNNHNLPTVPDGGNLG
ncbi:hypothetical protein NONI108955_20720 [Nocardia ninae]|uniref:Uncharacterized protein n=1 Tax=Nocardia ninae NBRC 108245 TaxID=1210091 RepID=A0A511M9V9_9NOCA|nr:hypothetical protein [Nocardia ninae]GEM37379.1 hypothetical protein NN4_18980 [Nocardia ninae NBRC 108245]